MASDRQQAERLADYSGGSMEHAAEMAVSRLVAVPRLVDRNACAAGDFDNVEFAKTLAAFVDAAGKEASARRARMRLVVGFAIDFYRELLRAGSGGPPVHGRPSTRGSRTVGTASGGRFEHVDLVAMIDRSIETLGHVDRNANQSAAAGVLAR